MALTPEEEGTLWKTVFGNGDTGLTEDMRIIKRSLYKNPDTGEQGLVADVRDIKKMVTQIRTGWWLISAGILVVQLLQLVGIIGK